MPTLDTEAVDKSFSVTAAMQPCLAIVTVLYCGQETKPFALRENHFGSH
ncbi:hypothetical protein MGWOODY_Clf1392 [hydrothermal vent metagenome]|uniref:Uncharacterized protein n=1 Tax=hydrothermal vent metagenome TaxID=652676 RepID=A0A160V9I1_9ZZZZ